MVRVSCFLNDVHVPGKTLIEIYNFTPTKKAPWRPDIKCFAIIALLRGNHCSSGYFGLIDR